MPGLGVQTERAHQTLTYIRTHERKEHKDLIASPIIASHHHRHHRLSHLHHETTIARTSPSFLCLALIQSLLVCLSLTCVLRPTPSLIPIFLPSPLVE